MTFNTNYESIRYPRLYVDYAYEPQQLTLKRVQWGVIY